MLQDPSAIRTAYPDQVSVLKIPFLPEGGPQPALTLQPISQEPWPAFRDARASAAFSIAYDATGIHLYFVVCEPFLRASKRPPNAEVHHDNCVEFFIALDNTGGYYNFEFNCMGSIKAAYGPNRHQRSFLPETVLRGISDQLSISLHNLAEHRYPRWEICAVIPLDAFVHHPQLQLPGLQCTANFAKCGDELPEPHFKSWMPIQSATPDFHQPEAFGSIVFEPPYEP
ncbi:hypothetical protein DCC81_15375 [Chitinophaga parva]|uniref:Carbohydrate-binding domain-containing protein n=1 Tax=Chitinophaga parva TaxID=2169414 RepID=A0A2T7BH95_9BACT|nr:carbohydrate-binding family 9-like protein [Chitinophaga parva]PUZ25650.1 hypothetical protein DCC81_15375 [Chitinophaga parva]